MSHVRWHRGQIKDQDNIWKEFRRKRGKLEEFTAGFLASKVIGSKWGEKLLDALKTEPWSPEQLHQLETTLTTLFELIDPKNRDTVDKPLVLFVDDLDRCLPDPALAVLEALKLVLNRPGLITIMGVAEDELRQSVMAAYAKEWKALGIDVDPKWARKYLRKIIQMPFPLPVISTDTFHEYVADCLSRSQVCKALRERMEWCAIIGEASAGNLREVKRFINHFISETDKAAANEAAADVTKDRTRLTGDRVALVLLLAWRFPEFFRRIRETSDPKLFIRYQLHFTHARDVEGRVSFKDEDKPFIEDTALGDLFVRCLVSPAEGEPPLVTPFTDWSDLAPYLQFGRPSPIVPHEAEEEKFAAAAKQPTVGVKESAQSEDRAGAEEPVDKPGEVPREVSSVDEQISKILSSANSLIASRDYEEAARQLDSGLRITRDRGDRVGQGVLFGSMGMVDYLRGRTDRALKSLGISVDFAREVGDARTAADSLSKMGMILQESGDLPQALDTLEQARRIYEELGDSLGEWETRHRLGSVHQASDNFSTANEMFLQALDITGRIGHRAGQLVTLTSLAETREKLGSFDDALALCDESQKLAIELGDRSTEYQVLAARGRLLMKLGKDDEAVNALQLAATIAGEIGAHDGQIQVIEILAVFYGNQGRYAEAEPLYARALAIREQVLGPEHPDVAMVLEDIAQLYRMMGKKDEVERLEERAKKIRSRNQ